MDTEEISIWIFNPTSEDFTYLWHGDPYTIPSMQARQFEKPLADHLAKHLKDEIVGKKQGVITDSILQEVLDSIYL